MKKSALAASASVLMLLLAAGIALAQYPGEPTQKERAEWENPGVTVFKWILDALLPDPSVLATAPKALILFTPDPMVVGNLVEAYVELLHPIFIMMIVLSGAYLIFMSGSPGGRAKAKSMFWKTFITMVLVSYSLEIFKIMVDLSQAITLKVLSIVTSGALAFDGFAQLEFFALYMLVAIIFWPLFLLSVGIRYLLVLLLAALFPITILLYFFELPFLGPITKETAAKLWNTTLAVIFSQVVQGMALTATVIAFSDATSSLGGELARLLVGAIGLVLMAIAPLMMSGVLQWLGGIVMGLGMMVSMGNPVAGYAVTALGGMMMGMGPASLMAAGGAGGLGYAAGMTKQTADWEAKNRQAKNQGGQH